MVARRDAHRVVVWFVKNIIRSKAYNDEDLIRADFKSYVEMQIGMMMEDSESAREAARRMARGHFRLCGFEVDVEEDM